MSFCQMMYLYISVKLQFIEQIKVLVKDAVNVIMDIDLL